MLLEESILSKSEKYCEFTTLFFTEWKNYVTQITFLFSSVNIWFQDLLDWLD